MKKELDIDILYLSMDDSSDLGIYNSTDLLKSEDAIDRANRMSIEEFIADFNSDMISDQGIIALAPEDEEVGEDAPDFIDKQIETGDFENYYREHI